MKKYIYTHLDNLRWGPKKTTRVAPQKKILAPFVFPLQIQPTKIHNKKSFRIIPLPPPCASWSCVELRYPSPNLTFFFKRGNRSNAKWAKLEIGRCVDTYVPLQMNFQWSQFCRYTYIYSYIWKSPKLLSAEIIDEIKFGMAVFHADFQCILYNAFLSSLGGTNTTYSSLVPSTNPNQLQVIIMIIDHCSSKWIFFKTNFADFFPFLAHHLDEMDETHETFKGLISIHIHE